MKEQILAYIVVLIFGIIFLFGISYINIYKNEIKIWIKKISKKLLYWILICVAIYIICYLFSGNIMIFTKIWFIILACIYLISTLIIAK